LHSISSDIIFPEEKSDHRVRQRAPRTSKDSPSTTLASATTRLGSECGKRNNSRCKRLRGPGAVHREITVPHQVSQFQNRSTWRSRTQQHRESLRVNGGSEEREGYCQT